VELRLSHAGHARNSHHDRRAQGATNGMEREPSIFLCDHGDDLRRRPNLDRQRQKITAASDGDVRAADVTPEAPVIVGPTGADVYGVRGRPHNGCSGGQGRPASATNGKGNVTCNPLRVSATVSYELARCQGPHFGKEAAQRGRTMGHPKGDLGVHAGRYRPNSPTPNGSGGRPHQEVCAILRKTRIQLKRFRSIVGRLQHAARIQPAARGFFTPLYNALKGLPTSISLGRHGEVRHALLDVANVIQNLASRPTHVNELVQQLLNYAGYCDASAFGAGGVWFGANLALPPSVWQVQWPSDITNDVVSDANPNGRLTNSDLELAAVVLQEAILEARLGPSIAGTQAAIGSDNTPTVAWSTRMASRSGSPISFRLLRGKAMRQRTNRSAPTAVFHVAGMENILANVASRPDTGIASHYHMFEHDPNAMCPKDFLTHFTTSYPLPQQRPWLNVQPPSGLWSNVISTLRV